MYETNEQRFTLFLDVRMRYSDALLRKRHYDYLSEDGVDVHRTRTDKAVTASWKFQTRQYGAHVLLRRKLNSANEKEKKDATNFSVKCMMNFLSYQVKLSGFVLKNVNLISLKFSTEEAGRKSGKIMKVLNVAEKNDAAKSIASILGRGNCNRREGLSVYNKIYQFNLRLFNQDCQMIMTSVSGHLLTYGFTGVSKQWLGCHPISLFDAPVVKHCPENFQNIKKTLEREVKSCTTLIIWTDCDREGENIGFEIIDVCKAVKPNIKVYRATFSEITQTSLQRAIQNLGEPNKLVNDAVDVRSELDLRIGASFTRFQTLRLQKAFPRTLHDMLISYGSCQFPTLGFVVERFLAIERFQSEPYWKIKVVDDRDNIHVEFRWARNRLFEELPCQVYLDICLEQPDATVVKVIEKPKSKWRPLPLDTIELEKQSSRKLRLNAKETMKIAEKLYTQGFISYPRTETNIFPKELNLEPLVQQQVNHQAWGEFAQRVLNDGISPRQGKKTDQAHPPIHPTKFAGGLQGNEAKVYEFVVRHFLACLSKNAEGHETTVDIDIAGEKFTASGLQILTKNYLDVYIYEKWNAKEIHLYQQGQVFAPTSIEMVKENTSAPNLLTEADLIALMDKHGIGTDATHAEHIETIKSREYVGLRDGTHFIPGKLGIGLVMGYDNMGFQMSKPHLRAELENDLKAICEGRKDPQEVLRLQISKYRDVFKIALERATMIDAALARYLEETPTSAQELENVIPVDSPAVFKCPRCGSKMELKDKRQGTGKFIGCAGYPTCNNSIWLPQDVMDVDVLEEVCGRCPGDFRKLKVKMKPGSFPTLGTTYTACIGGCDSHFNECMDIRDTHIRRTERPNDSGYGTTTITTSSSSSSGVTQTANASRGRGRGTSQAGNSLDRGNSQRPRGGGTSQRPSAPTRKRPAPSPGPGHDNPPTFKRPSLGSGASTIGNRENLIPVSPWGVVDDNAVILCECNEGTNLLTVSKEGPNKGRKFYKCAKPRDAQCTFFMWADDEATQTTDNNRANTSHSRPPPPPSTFNRESSARPNVASVPSGDGAPTCACGQPTVQRTVRKEGPNTGRKFWGCPQGPGSTCNFFSWADETPQNDRGIPGGSNFDGSGWDAAPPTRRGGSSSERGRGRGGGASGAPATKGKRKCGICGVEGHTKKTCPQR